MPVIVGATVGFPSSVTPVSVTTSLVSKAIELAVAGAVPSSGADVTIVGSVLSIRTFVATSLPWLLNASTATARMS